MKKKRNAEYISKLKELLILFENDDIEISELNKIYYYQNKFEDLINSKISEKEISKKFDKKERAQQKKSFNGLSAKEWAALSKNVWNDLSSPRKKHHLTHGATFSQKLADRVIKMYSKKGDLIFDPFLGTGTTLLSAKSLDRKGIGIELTKKFFKIAEEEIMTDDLLQNEKQLIYKDDCRNLEKYLEDDSIQLTFTSPPYADFIHKTIEDRKKVHKKSAIVNDNNSKSKPYSNLKNDFGNLSYKNFLEESKLIMEKIYKKTKKNGYNIWVVKDYRNTKDKVPYIPFHSDLAKVGEEAGFKNHDLIIWDQNAQRSLILLGYPSVFYTNQNSSFLVVLKK